MTLQSGTIVRWDIDGKPDSDKSGNVGWFSKWALPVPGDRVQFYSGDDAYVVEVLYRVFDQPEREPPRVWIKAKAL